MISKDCNFSDFIGAIRGRDYFETIFLADKEATEAERLLLRASVNERRQQRCGMEYAQMIKNLIFFVRYGIKPYGVDTREFEMIQSLGSIKRPRRGV